MIREFLRGSTILFAKIINSKGPKLDHSGTRQVTKPDSKKGDTVIN